MKKKSNKTGDVSNPGFSEAVTLNPALRERIERKAYELYEKRGGAHGLDTEDWFEAERLVLAETQVGTKAETVVKVKASSRKRTMRTKSGSVLDRPRSA